MTTRERVLAVLVIALSVLLLTAAGLASTEQRACLLVVDHDPRGQVSALFEVRDDSVRLGAARMGWEVPPGAATRVVATDGAPQLLVRLRRPTLQVPGTRSGQ